MKTRRRILRPDAGITRAACRFKDWPTRFFAFIESRRHLPHTWGINDCCIFTCDGILAQTGLDPAAKLFRGKYRDALGATRLVRKHGGIEAIARKVCREHGYKPISPALASRGDVVLLPARATGNPGKGPALGMAVGGGQAAFAGPAGLVFLPVSSCSKAWRVG